MNTSHVQKQNDKGSKIPSDAPLISVLLQQCEMPWLFKETNIKHFQSKQKKRVLLHHLNAISLKKEKKKTGNQMTTCVKYFGKCNAESLVKSCANTSTHKVTRLKNEQ